MKDYERLHVWVKAHALAIEIHGTTKRFPREELFCLTSQMRRCSMSVPSNIAEGTYRRSGVEFARFLLIALSSAAELRYQLLYARDLGYLQEPQYQDLRNKVEEVMKMLYGLVRRLQ